MSPTPSSKPCTQDTSEQVVARILMRGQFQWQVVFEEPDVQTVTTDESAITSEVEPPPSPAPRKLDIPVKNIFGEGDIGLYTAITFYHINE